ncbi:PIR protein [Plasmodium vivax]|uniref:VIR protein n=1 Tax=Plasmodium vivax TaxID=5855 RepID=A0A565A039_PLAVI|nr:PIR protein [Plasmodium vivax]
MLSSYANKYIYILYDFFENIKTYTKNAENLFSDNTPVEPSKHCTSFSTEYQHQNPETAKVICEEFTKLYNSLSPNNTKPNYKNDCLFLNYWLNFRLMESNINGTDCVKNFGNAMKTHCTDTFGSLSSLNFIYDIDNDNLNKMNKLYKLHHHIIKMHNILIKNLEGESISALTLSDELLANYRTFTSMCNGNNNELCKSLQDFKKLYKQLYDHAQRKGEPYSNYVIQLTEGNNNIITTPLLCSIGGLIPLLGILYRFTPMGQIFRSKNKKFTKEYSNNYNDQISLYQEKYNIKYDSVA